MIRTLDDLPRCCLCLAWPLPRRWRPMPPVARACGRLSSSRSKGPFGTYDQMQLQRGLQVYTEVCSACHGLKYVPLRAHCPLKRSGLAAPEDQVRAYAEILHMRSGTRSCDGDYRPARPTDHFPEVTALAKTPDLSLMAKARAGFHGPYGTWSQPALQGHGRRRSTSPRSSPAIPARTKEEAGAILYENTAFPGGYHRDGTAALGRRRRITTTAPEATIEQQAKDVAAFLMWAAEPKMMERKQAGFRRRRIFLIVLSALLYLTNKRLWAPIKRAAKDGRLIRHPEATRSSARLLRGGAFSLSVAPARGASSVGCRRRRQTMGWRIGQERRKMTTGGATWPFSSKHRPLRHTALRIAGVMRSP
jgi:ubiquinol-cytochrome c reductase cytochrome c1 subunit